jgi:predicted nuclease of predicted toxin-antitoxin system
MGTAKLLANENFPGPAVRLLREKGADIAWASESMASAPDVEVLARARAECRWLLTYDRDYGELVFSRGLRPPRAIVYLRQEPYPPTRPAELILQLMAEPERVAGLFLVVSERSIRIRHLPQGWDVCR